MVTTSIYPVILYILPTVNFDTHCLTPSGSLNVYHFCLRKSFLPIRLHFSEIHSICFYVIVAFIHLIFSVITWFNIIFWYRYNVG